MFKRVLLIILSVILVFTLSGCKKEASLGGESQAQSQTQSGGETSSKEETTTSKIDLSPTFSKMPDMYTDMADVILQDKTALFSFITPGLDSSNTYLVSYDMENDEKLGEKDIGEDTVSVFSYRENCFAVLSHSKKTFTVYDRSLNKLSEASVSGVDSYIGIAALSKETLLISQIRDGGIYIYSLANHKLTPVDLGTSGTVFEAAGNFGDDFVIKSGDGYLYKVGLDGKAEKLDGKMHSSATVTSSYAAEITGDYLVLHSLLGADSVMAALNDNSEIICASSENEILSHSQTFDGSDTLYYYDMTKKAVAKASANGQILGADVCEGYAVSVIRTDASKPLEYSYTDFSAGDFAPIGSMEYDKNTINGIEPLPQPDGNAETLALINRIYDKYGVRIMYESQFFRLEDTGFELCLAKENEVYEYALHIEKVLEFFPDGVFKEIGETLPVVVFLCESINPSVGGLNTILDGYNVSFIPVGGNTDYFLNVVAHELAHAVERRINITVLSGWNELMPQEAQDAYSNLSLTVEFTPDDKGRTPVWFIDAYGRSDSCEDRAVLFAYLFGAYSFGNDDFLSYDGIKQKANYWGTMLRESYKCCENVQFKWESLIK